MPASFHDRLVGGAADTPRLPILYLEAALDLQRALGVPTLAAIETAFDLSDADADWLEFNKRYGEACNKQAFVSAALKMMLLAEGRLMGMDDRNTFFTRLQTLAGSV